MLHLVNVAKDVGAETEQVDCQIDASLEQYLLLISTGVVYTDGKKVVN